MKLRFRSIRLIAVSASCLAFALCLGPGARSAPVNDLCSGAQIITGLPWSGECDVSSCTSSASDPLIPCYYGGPAQGYKSVWYRYTAADSTPIEASTIGSDYDTELVVYTGSCGDLTSVVCSEDTGDLLHSKAQWTPAAGTAYYIEVASYSDDAGELHLSIRNLAPAAANDDCAQAQAISSLPFTATLDTSGCTSAPDDPMIKCFYGGASQAYKSVWFKYTAADSGALRADTLGSDYDTEIAIFTGACGSLTPVGCDEDIDAEEGDLQSSVDWIATEGVTYHIEVTSYGDDGGTLIINVGSPPVPGNDDMAGATLLSEPTDSLLQSTVSATVAPGEPMPSCRAVENTVWFKFVPDDDGLALLSTAGSSFDTVLAVYRDTVQIACNDDEPGSIQQNSGVALNVTAGTTYYVQAGGAGSSASGTLNLAYGLGPTASSTISDLKFLPAGSRVTLLDKVVTAKSEGALCLQEPTRFAGALAAVNDGLSFPRGTRVSAVGTVARDSISYIYSTVVVGTAEGTVRPLGLRTKDIGGGKLGEQEGAPGGAGVNNIGTLVRVWGKVTAKDSVDGQEFYWLDDGCGVAHEVGRAGIRVNGNGETGEYREVIGVVFLWYDGVPYIYECPGSRTIIPAAL